VTFSNIAPFNYKQPRQGYYVSGIAGLVRGQYSSIADALDSIPELSSLAAKAKGNPLLASKIKATVFAPTDVVRGYSASNMFATQNACSGNMFACAQLVQHHTLQVKQKPAIIHAVRGIRSLQSY
jgi:hypothetical protein